MNNTITKIIKLILSAGGMAILLFNAKEASKGAVSGLNLCAETVIPSLFPFMVISSYMIKSGALSVLGKRTEKICSLLFDLPKQAGAIFVMSLISGYPVGPAMIMQELRRGALTQNQGKRMLLFCVNPGPAFVVNMVGVSMLGSKKAGVILLASVAASSLIMGICSRFFSDKETTSPKGVESKEQSPLTASVNAGVESIIKICGWIICFCALIETVKTMPIPYEIKLWMMLPGEVTLGCRIASAELPLSVCAFLLSWGGFAVHAQISESIALSALKYRYFFVASLLRGALSLSISTALFKLFPCEMQVFSNMGEIIPESVCVSLPAAGALVLLTALIILDLAPKEKV